jgi:HTH-type transcriptional regulator, sugar sensing transcriptional regulator
MRTIPASLTKALNDLGLSNYEASVYAALVLFDNAEAKEIIEFLGISKPSVYEALDQLESVGLAIKRITKPARYSAISPEMAIDLLMNQHKRAADIALTALKTLEKEHVQTDREDALWTIYGDANIEFKIQDLFRKAGQQIWCTIGERYLSILRKCRMQDIPLQLIVISDSPDLGEELHRIFPGIKADIHVVSSEKFLIPPPFAPKEFARAKDFMNFENILELIVDDEELLMVPPFFSGTISVLNTRNKGAIFQMKMLGEMNRRRLIEGNDFPFPVPPLGKPPHSRKK